MLIYLRVFIKQLRSGKYPADCKSDFNVVMRCFMFEKEIRDSGTKNYPKGRNNLSIRNNQYTLSNACLSNSIVGLAVQKHTAR